jgi:hypothetical protein
MVKTFTTIPALIIAIVELTKTIVQHWPGCRCAVLDSCSLNQLAQYVANQMKDGELAPPSVLC